MIEQILLQVNKILSIAHVLVDSLLIYISNGGLAAQGGSWWVNEASGGR